MYFSVPVPTLNEWIMSLSSKDYQALLGIIEEVAHSFPDRTSTFLTVCEQLDKLVGISTAVFIPINPTAKTFESPGLVTYQCPVDCALPWLEHYAELDPLVTQWDGTVNGAVQNTDLVSASSLENSEFYQDFLSTVPCFHISGSYLGMQGDPVALMGLHRLRHDRPFSARELEIIRLLMPHLSQALHNLNLTEAIASDRGYGVVVIAADGQVSYINDEALRALNGRPVAAILNPGLAVNPVFFQTETGIYRVRAQAKQGRLAKTILLEPLPAVEDIQSKLVLFGLTKRQREIAFSTIRGLSNREIAVRLHIAEQTVKDHLRDVFDKMRVRRRSELIAKIFGIAAY